MEKINTDYKHELVSKSNIDRQGGCLQFTQRNRSVNGLGKWYAKITDGKFRSDCHLPFRLSPPPPFFFRLSSNAFSDFGSVGRSEKEKKNSKNKIEKESGARRPGTST